MISFTTPPETLVWTVDYRNFRNALPIRYRDENGTLYQAPGGSLTDVASTPPILWGPPENLPPFGDYGTPANLHDQGYRDTLEKQSPAADQETMAKAQALRQEAVGLLQQADDLERFCWIKASLNRDSCDNLFNDAMMARGVKDETRTRLYEGVHLFGWRSFREDRQG